MNNLKDKRSKLLLDAQTILMASPDAEKRSSAMAMLADATILEQDIKALESIEAAQAETRSKATPPRTISSEVSNDSEKETRAAFESYIKTGVKSSKLTENRDLSTTTGATMVPQGFYPVLTEALKSYGYILNSITQYSTDNGAPLKYAVIDDTGNGLTVIAEGVAASETDPTLSGALISTDEVTTGVVKVSIAQLQDSGFSVEGFLRDSLLNRYFRGLANSVTLGNASNVASLTTSAYAAATSAAPTVIAWADVVALFAALDPAYEANACWSMNATTRGALLATVDTLGRPLYVPAPNSGAFDTILGKKVVINPSQASIAATNVALMFGDFSKYILRTVKPGLSVTRLNERYMDQNQVGFIGFARVGGALLQATACHPVVKLTQHI